MTRTLGVASKDETSDEFNGYKKIGMRAPYPAFGPGPSVPVTYGRPPAAFRSPLNSSTDQLPKKAADGKTRSLFIFKNNLEYRLVGKETIYEKG